MQWEITRLPTDERTYVVVTAIGTRFGIRDFELKRWLLNLGAGDSTVAAVLDIDPNETMTVRGRQGCIKGNMRHWQDGSACIVRPVPPCVFTLLRCFLFGL